MLFAGDKITGTEPKSPAWRSRAQVDEAFEAPARRNQLSMRKCGADQAIAAVGLKNFQRRATVLDGITY